jgi:hypothetical protein
MTMQAGAIDGAKKEFFNDAKTSLRPLIAAGGKATAAIETGLAKMPFVSFLGLAGISMIASATIASTRKKEADYASFVGLWAPCFILLGIYNKLVQVERTIEHHATMPPPAAIPSPTAYLS